MSHARRRTGIFAALCCVAFPAIAGPADHDYPTAARFEYVQECIEKNGGIIANVYKCSCVLDTLMQKLTYDEFVEAGTFARYASLGGEAGGIFRDSKEAKDKAKLFRSLETEAYAHCALTKQ